MISTILFIVGIVFTCAYLTLKISKDAEVNLVFIIFWFIAAIAKVLIVCVLFGHFGTSTDPIWADTLQYLRTGKALADGQISLSGLLVQRGWPPHVGYELLVSLLIKTFGYNELIISLTNGFISILAAYFFYELSKFFVDKRTAFFCSLFLNIYPTVVHFSFYILKDVLIMLMVELVLLFYLKTTEKKNAANIVMVVLALFLLVFLRTFFAIMLLFIILINTAVGKDKITKIIIAAMSIALLVAVSGFTGISTLSNMGYTVGGGGDANSAALAFLPQLRLEPNMASMKLFFSLLAGNLKVFLIHDVKMVFLILWGPSYWFASSGAALVSKYGRFVLFENLGSIFMTLIVPGLFYSLLSRRDQICNKKLVLISLAVMFAALFIGSDIRWKLSVMPVIIMLCINGINKIFHSKQLTLCYMAYLCSFIFLVGYNAT